MTEFYLPDHDPSAIIETRFKKPIWAELIDLLKQQSREVVLEVNQGIAQHLEMLILKELYDGFETSTQLENLPGFIDELNALPADSQIAAIEKKLMGGSAFWSIIEADLIDQLINGLIEKLKD